MLEWPLKDEKGKFQTTPTAKEVWVAAMQAVAELSDESVTPELHDRIQAWMHAMHDSPPRAWRKDYMSLVEEFGIIMATLPPQQTIVAAKAGLDALQDKMQFSSTLENDKEETSRVSVKEAFSKAAQIPSLWETSTVHGGHTATNEPSFFPLPSPRDDTTTDHTLLFQQDAVKQVNAWLEYGCMEPSAAAHASRTLLHANQSELVQDKIFVLLGATSAVGPARVLLRIPHVHLLAIARPGPKLQALVQEFRDNAHPSSTLQYPKDGADLLEEGPQIAQWIVQTLLQKSSQGLAWKQVVLCNLAYMDGEAHVRTNVAMDAISQVVCEAFNSRDGQDVALSYLTSPSTVCVVPPEAAQDCQRRFDHDRLISWQRWVHTLSGGRWLQPWNFESGQGQPEQFVLNGMSSVQGPNYALAKTMQQWRCMVAACQEKRLVSAPMAPPTRTDSMVRYDTIATVLEGMQHFEPMLTFDTEPASSLMTAILLSQVNTTTTTTLAHPTHVVWDGSVHGGSWRCPYLPESSGTLSYLMGKITPSHWVPVKSLANEDGDDTE